MTNAEKIIALLSKNPEMDDDEISSCTNIRPRQQVNQICRKLESQGQIRRVIGPKGKVTNSLIEFSTVNRLKSSENILDGGSDNKTGPKKQQATLSSWPLVQINLKLINELSKSKTLILIPCSGTKSTNLVSKSKNPTIAASLPADIKEELLSARFELANLAHLDEGDLCPAWKRYTGTLYTSAAPALASAIKQGSHIAIISGGYGLLLAEEPIGTQDSGSFSHFLGRAMGAGWDHAKRPSSRWLAEFDNKRKQGKREKNVVQLKWTDIEWTMALSHYQGYAEAVEESFPNCDYQLYELTTTINKTEHSCRASVS